MAIVVPEGDVSQEGGVISGAQLALEVSGNVGSFDGTNPTTEVAINANSLVLDVGGDAILNQATGDLSFVNQATIGGEVFTTQGIRGDLRVQVTNGSLAVNTKLDVGGDVALVTGTDLTINPQTLPNSVTLNEDVTANQNLVIISAGDIQQTTGALRAPNIGLGANGSIGSAASRIELETNNLTLFPSIGLANDPNGFTNVNRVSAVGATVNQGTPTTPPVPPVPIPIPVPPPDIDGIDTIISSISIDPESTNFAQNSTELIEELLEEIMNTNITDHGDIDPTRIPTIWFDDDDFLHRKIRRMQIFTE